MENTGIIYTQDVYTIEGERLSIDVRVQNLSYVVNPVTIPWWQKLYSLQLPWESTHASSGPRQILDNVSFTVQSGQVLAIMGSSGSGKTSLLDVIAGRTNTGMITGDVFLNTIPRSNAMLQACSAYVRLPHLTVKETLMFVAQLKLPTSLKRRELNQRVEYVISELGLRHVAGTKVGNAENRGVSGGERRRVSIGIQLLLDPSVLFLDEPTSGLDSFTAHHLVETLSNLAKNNRTVLLSIHQPRSDIFELFDSLLLLTRGKIVYCGEASKMVDYFTGYGYPCPALTNPCDFYIDLATIDTTTESSENLTSDIVNSLTQAYTSVIEDSMTSSASAAINAESIMAVFDNITSLPGVWKQFNVLCRRSIRNIMEDYTSLAAQCIEAVVMSIVVGLVYFKLGDDQAAMRDRFGLMYIIGALYPYMIVLDLITQYHQERSFLYYELEDGLYFHGPYFFAKIFSELIFHTLYITLYSIPMYFLTGMQVDALLMLQVFAIIFLMVYCSRSLAMFASAIMPTFQLSCFFAQTIFSMYIMSAGFFINLQNIFDGLKWVSSISYLKWGFQGLCLTLIKDQNFTCASPDTRVCIYTGDEALRQFSLEGNYVWEACVVMIGSILVYLTFFYICLKFIPQKPNE